MVKNYNNLTLEEIESRIKENNRKLKEIWDTDNGSSWEVYREKCRPYWDEDMPFVRLRH